MPGRDNGFVARHYVPLADLDPRLADAMLDALRTEGIAAYVVPSTGRLGGYLEVHLPERPRDRLWVDREHHDRAAALLALQGDRPEIIAAPADDDATDGADFPDALAGDTTAAESGDPTDDAWARLVADFNLPSHQGEGRWPLAEDLPVDADQSVTREGDRGTASWENPYGAQPGDASTATTAPVPRRIVRPVDRNLEAGTPNTPPSGEYDPLSILDEHFVPDPPPPLPRLRPGTRWALAAILLGVLLIVGRAFWDYVPDAVGLGVLAVVGGFVALVAMMREDRPSDSDPDDGAVV